MESVTLNILNQKLKNAPQEVLERVVGYVDALLEKNKSTAKFELTEDQYAELQKRFKNAKKEDFIPWEIAER